MRNKNKSLIAALGHFSVVLMVAMLLMVAWTLPTQVLAASAKAPDKILFGNPIALSGISAPGAMMTQIRAYDLWVETVNAQGGIYVKEYGKKIPVEIIRYDDKSDIGTSVKLTEKLLLQDKVHFILPPWGTAFHFAIAPVINKYKSPVVGITVSSLKLKELAPKIPYMFIMLNQPDEQGQALVDLSVELGVKSAAVIHHTDLHGIEMAGAVLPQLAVSGIDVALYKTYPLGAKDLSPLLKKVKAANVDAFFAFSYPPETFLLTGQAKAIQFNPKLFYTSIGTAFAAYNKAFGAKMVEGVMGTRVPGTRKCPIPERKNFLTGWLNLWVWIKLTGMGMPLPTLRSKSLSRLSKGLEASTG